MPATAFLTIGILVLTPESFELTVNDLYTSARTVIEAETVLSVAPVDLFSESVRQVAIRRCAGDAKCFLSQFEQSGVSVDLLLTISVARLDERLLLGLRLLSSKSASELAAGGGEIAWDLPLARVMEAELARIFPRELWGRVSHVEVRAEPEGAEVKLAGKSCRAPCRIERIEPGSHEVLVERRGYSTYRGRVEAVAKKGAVLEVKLLSLPEPEAALYESPVFWVAASALVVGSVAAIAVLTSGEESDLVCIYPDLNACPK